MACIAASWGAAPLAELVVQQRLSTGFTKGVHRLCIFASGYAGQCEAQAPNTGTVSPKATKNLHPGAWIACVCVAWRSLEAGGGGGGGSEKNGQPCRWLFFLAGFPQIGEGCASDSECRGPDWSPRQIQS